ncbi:type II toxin-antitoxin system RelE/ParE family toxin [Asticcacaulis sp. EMRT-3]|uniref:type II toxin-antitoxin system RelE/ParE family toxin n=1 Tax=Asticcacaulis sp. EMRT-3 TaxID=3040349 RepID=UPI0024AF8C71|nr:type II toxin-antitoxin system RelE/ParE family toxin [Asticcacaulis sp. EMRT-3]MDI7776287.1 type II toxin-antitoxin system RelE/ParE family toxin [Asticcacaulis sp. EMRT-3]
MKLVWAPKALADRLNILEFIAADNPRAALGMDDLFRRAAEGLLDFPQQGRPGSIAGTRELIPHEHYRLIYEIQSEEIRELALISTWRQWPPVS